MSIQQKVFGRETYVQDGTEYDRDITCCMFAKRKLQAEARLFKHMEMAIDAIRPEQFKVGFSDFWELNFCPICGSQYADEE